MYYTSCCITVFENESGVHMLTRSMQFFKTDNGIIERQIPK